MINFETIAELDELDDEELFEELGRELLHGTSAAGPLDGSGFRSYGRGWFQKKLPEFKKALCGNKVVSALYDKRYEDVVNSVDMFAELTKVVEDNFGYSGATTVTMLILRYGLRKLCSDHLSS